MLVTFSCDAYENITLFGSIAERLLVMMGQRGGVPGAILADDVPAALLCLQAAIDREKQRRVAHPPRELDDDDDQEVSLVQRAIPVIALLQAAERAKCDVMWG